MSTHKIYPHGAFEPLSEGVWWVKGGLPFPLHRNMIALRLPTGELLLHSVVALDDDGMLALEKLGVPSFAIVPSTGHTMDIGFYKARYPALKVVTPAMYRAAIEAKVEVSGTVEDVLPQFGFKLHLVPGTRLPEYIYEWPLRDGGNMLIANDTLGSAEAGVSARLIGRLFTRLTGRTLGISRFYRLALISDLPAMKACIAGLADVPDLRLVTVSHGNPVTHDAAAALRAAAR